MSHGVTYTWDLNHDTNQQDYKTKTESLIQRTGSWWPRGTGEEEGKSGIHRGKLSHMQHG